MARDILKALHANAQQGRSGLYRWLSLNFEKLKPGMAGPRPPWVALAKTAAELGITNGGKHRARRSDRHGCESRPQDGRGAAATPARRPPSVPLGPDPSPASHAAGAPPAPVVAAPAPPADPAADPPPPRRRIELKPVTMRNSIPPPRSNRWHAARTISHHCRRGIAEPLPPRPSRRRPGNRSRRFRRGRGAVRAEDTPAVDLPPGPRAVFLLGPGNVGKTTYARWLVWRMAERAAAPVSPP